MSQHTERRQERQSGSAPGKSHFYRVYGLVVDSEIELPELVPIAEEPAQVTIRYGDVPVPRPEERQRWYFYSAERRELIFYAGGVAAYLIADGSRITIERRLGFDASAPPPDIRLWLLRSAFAALLHQRGLLPLKGASVSTPDGAWVFTGETGAGTSMLATFLHRRFDWLLVSDDVSVIDQSGARPMVHPGPRKLNLSPDALPYLGIGADQAVRDLSTLDEAQLYLAGDDDHQPAVFHALVTLDSGDSNASPGIRRLSGLEAFQACLGSVYRPSMQHHFKLPQQCLAELAQLCRSVAVYRFTRPRSLEDFERNIEPLVGLMSDPGRAPDDGQLLA